MKSLRTLIKLAKSEVELRQKSLAEVISRQDKIIMHKTIAENTLAAESEATKKSPEMAGNFGAFAKVTLEKIEKFNKEIARLEKIIEQKREELRAAFAEQKRYEIALDMKMTEQAQTQNRIEQIKMDELAANSFRRKNS